ncbi:hypothetical protein MC378_14995 [Polaribacter sp. MSW13]|uniref:Uncharacterized protein n=1 Tax=Polaribacter marinus TaxID=2916838 RepID=A0A9X1VTC5_9FLAO|nr:hypothetical protein [Polaribacter marinus]MCI2230485.1 hypothetical protein [Polaribacter marinus]
MRKALYISILFLEFSEYSKAQISGQLFHDKSESPGIEIYFKNFGQKVESDFDGYFNLAFPRKNKKNDLIINVYGLKILILNIVSKQGKLNLGKVELPIFKSIEPSEFEQLSEKERKSCQPVYHYAQLLGYFYTNKLENEFLLLNCKEKIKDFEFNSETKTITIEWKKLKNCE